MSGSSLDGLDIACCRFELRLQEPAPEAVGWELLEAETLEYSTSWKERLATLPDANALSLALAHAQFGAYLGQLTNQFLESHPFEPDFIASHGHTLFHHPEQGSSFQLGDGASIAAITGYPAIDNFRMQDVALGGQGAPIAPIADQLLFPEYDFMLNLGGIANFSCKANGHYIAFDSIGANQLLNALAALVGKEYDAGGQLAASGKLVPALLEQGQQLSYFQQPYPKSLGNHWVQREMLPIYLNYPASVEDKLFTACYHIGQQIAQDISKAIQHEKMPSRPYRMLVTGGGAFNTFLVNQIQNACREAALLEIDVPPKEIVAFKEAILMALMGVLRTTGLPNCLPTVTNARQAAIGGAIHQGWKKLL